VAADPDFAVNRFLYFAITRRAPDGQRTVSVVRVRELANRVGEPATIIADLPAAPVGNPAIAVGPERRIYLAMPGAADDPTAYAGHVLRFTPDGRADGNARNGSPILAQGLARPTRLAWDAASRLLIASAESGAMPVLAVVATEPGSGRWPAAPISVAGTMGAAPSAGLSDLAGAPAVAETADVVAVATTGGAPGVLSLAAVTVTARPEIASARAVPLGPLTPTATAFANDGDLVIAATGANDAGAILVRLRRISAGRAP
jgi:hypothetical protein